MEIVTNTKLLELQTIISKMSLELCCLAVLPEFGVRWKDVSRAVRKARLPMTPSNISRIVCKGIGKKLSDEELDDIISRLRLKLVTTQSRTWYVINLLEPLSDECVDPEDLTERLVQALCSSRLGRNMTPQVQITQLGGLVFASVQLASNTRSSAPLYIATPPGLPVALTSTVKAKGILKPCIQALGYKTFEDANLYGRDIKSLLSIHAGSSENLHHFNETQEYAPVPIVTNSGIDYTNRAYDEIYVDNILGPNPPHLTDLRVTGSKPFFDSTRLNKNMKLTVQLKSEDVAKTLKSWVVKGALAPTSDFFEIFKKKSNVITLNEED